MQKTAYITGADRGLGLALTNKHLEEGYQVFAGSYMPDWPELQELKQKYQEQLTILSLDVTDDASVSKAAEAIAEQVEGLDVLVNNAAIYKDRSGSIFEELHMEDMLNMYNTNTLGTLRVTHSVIPLLLKGEQKSLVTISSEAGSVADCWRKQEYGYSMTKSAVNMQCAILQNHLKEFGIKVLAFHPGWLRSYMSGQLNEKATVEPKDSAEGIYHLIQTRRDIEGPMYMDYEGKELPY